MHENLSLFKALAHQSRLSLLGALLEQPTYVEVLAERLKLSTSTVSFHLKKLEAAGLVRSRRDQYYTVFTVDSGFLERPLVELLRPSRTELAAQERREQGYRAKVLANFFRYGKLLRIPVQRKKRRIVLEQIAQSFEAERVYSEREVNLIIADYHDDFCQIRRDMIDEGLMTGAAGRYRLVKA